MEHLHTIRVVARRTGLSPHLIRIWERRYGAVKPARTGTNRRLYSDVEIARLLMLQDATKAGHSIGRVAQLSEEQLRTLMSGESLWNGARTTMPLQKTAASLTDFVAESIEAIKQFDAHGLGGLLSRAALELGQVNLLQQVMVPLIDRIGSLWEQGVLKVAHEHFATAVIRNFLGGFARAYALSESAPKLVVATPAGHLHELGAILVSVLASNLGWKVIYLGASLPAEEIAGAVIANRAQAVALSLVFPQDDPYLESEMVRLRSLLPQGMVVLAGGRAARAYGPLLDKAGAIQIDDLPALQAKLEDLRKRR